MRSGQGTGAGHGALPVCYTHNFLGCPFIHIIHVIITNMLVTEASSIPVCPVATGN